MFDTSNRSSLGSRGAGRRLLTVGAAAALFSQTAGTGAAGAGAAVAGLVEEIKGQVMAELSARRRVLAPHEDVFVGDDVTTADNSRAAMLLGRDTSLRLGANARLRIDRFVINAGGVLTLENGSLLLDKMTSGPSGEVRIRGSFGLISVRGTRVFVGPGNGTTGIFVAHGVVTVTARGESFALQTGEGTDIGGPSSRPTPPALWGEARVRAALASMN